MVHVQCSCDCIQKTMLFKRKSLIILHKKIIKIFNDFRRSLILKTPSRAIYFIVHWKICRDPLKVHAIIPINKHTENIFIWVVVTKNRDIIRISPALWERLAQSPSQIFLDRAEYRGRPYSTDEQNFVWAKGKINQTSNDRKVRAIIVA